MVTLSLLFIAMVGGGLALVRARAAQNLPDLAQPTSEDGTDGTINAGPDELVIDLRTSEQDHSRQAPSSHASMGGASQPGPQTTGSGTITQAIAHNSAPPLARADDAPQPLRRGAPLTSHQARRLGVDLPLWRRALSGSLLLLTVIGLGVGIAVGVGVLITLAGLLVEQAV